MINSPSWPNNCTPLSFARDEERPRTVVVRVRVGWLFTREEVWRIRLAAHDNLRWYWAESGVRLIDAPSYVWSSLYEAIGEHP
jgi:hypothetical protein